MTVRLLALAPVTPLLIPSSCPARTSNLYCTVLYCTVLYCPSRISNQGRNTNLDEYWLGEEEVPECMLVTVVGIIIFAGTGHRQPCVVLLSYYLLFALPFLIFAVQKSEAPLDSSVRRHCKEFLGHLYMFPPESPLKRLCKSKMVTGYKDNSSCFVFRLFT